MKKSIVLTIVSTLLTIVSCSNPAIYEPKKTTEETVYIERKDDMFKTEISETSAERKYIFDTNNPTYITNDGYTIWTDKEINYSERFEEYEVELRKESGNANAGFGIVFAGVESEGKSKMMVVLINKNQYYLVGNVTDGIFQVSQDWNFTNRLRASTNVNRLKVTYNESTKKFSLYINETAEPEAVFSSAYNFTAKNSRRGFAAVISPGDNFPQTPVKVVYTIK